MSSVLFWLLQQLFARLPPDDKNWTKYSSQGHKSDFWFCNGFSILLLEWSIFFLFPEILGIYYIKKGKSMCSSSSSIFGGKMAGRIKKKRYQTGKMVFSNFCWSFTERGVLTHIIYNIQLGSLAQRVPSSPPPPHLPHSAAHTSRYMVTVPELLWSLMLSPQKTNQHTKSFESHQCKRLPLVNGSKDVDYVQILQHLADACNTFKVCTILTENTGSLAQSRATDHKIPDWSKANYYTACHYKLEPRQACSLIFAKVSDSQGQVESCYF